MEDRLLALPESAIQDTFEEPGGEPSYLTSLRRSQASLLRQIGLQESTLQIQRQLEAVEDELRLLAQGGPDEDQTFDIGALDDLQRRDMELGRQLANQRQVLDSARTTLELERSNLRERETARRRLLDRQRDGSTASGSAVERERRQENAEAAVEAARFAVELAKSEVEQAESELQLLERRRELAKFKIEIAQSRVEFDEESLRRQLRDLETARTQITEELEKTQELVSLAEQRLSEVAEKSRMTPERRARVAWLETHQRRLSLLQQRLELNLTRRDLWERRFLASGGGRGVDSSRWSDSARGLILRLTSGQESLQNELRNLRAELSEVLERSQEEEPALGASPSPDWHEITAQALIARQNAIEEVLGYFATTASLAQRLVAELEVQEQSMTLGERVRGLWQSALDFWNIELYTIGDSAVTVGKVNVALVVLIVGLLVTGRFTRLVGQKLFARLPIKESIRVNLERLFRYLFILLVFLFALHVVNIPLTIFTFLGGTLAIAVGFGAQNILNNFISGLILMVEQPVRVGDLIEVDQTLGFVEEIGARSTRVRGSTGIHIILPNAHLLENRVINWTLADKRSRTEVSVGVAYGSPVEQVMELIAKAVAEADLVVQVPPPIVTFDDFNDSSLDFTVYFWVLIERPIDRRRAQTQVRINIDRLFREHGIEIPFPQRDLNFSQAVPVRLVAPDPESAEESPEDHLPTESENPH